MPGFVTCPTCREELDIPTELRGRPVRCAACGETFTPPADEAAPVARRASRPEPRDDPTDDREEDDDQRPRRRDFARRPPRRKKSNAWVWILLFGTFSVCCLGCGGFLVFAMKFADPKLVDYKSPDGRFDAAFPGKVAVATEPQPQKGDLGATTTYEHARTMLGAPIDTYFVRSIEFRRPPTKASGDRAVKEVVDELAASGTNDRRSVASLDGVTATEIFVTLPEDGQALLARIAVIGDRLYVVGVRGQSIDTQQEQIRVRTFWDRFAAKGKRGE